MSYASQQFLIHDCSTDANFRAWGSAISAAIAAMGWVSNGDSGQVNWATVTSPAGGSTVYECWKPGDAGTTFVLRVDYGSTGGTPKGPRFKMSIGTGSNGAGTLTGTTYGQDPAGTANFNGTGAVTYDCYFSGDTDRMCMMLWRSLNANECPFMFVIERTHNADGSNNNDGVTFASFNNGTVSTGTGLNQGTLVFGVGLGNQSAQKTYVFLSNGQNAAGAFNNNIPLSPMFPDYGKYGNPLTQVGWVHTQDVAEACFFTTTLYGATRTYIASGLLAPIGTYKTCMRFD